jgi:hypothetical protein
MKVKLPKPTHCKEFLMTTEISMCHLYTICRAKFGEIKVSYHRLSAIMDTFWDFCPKFVSNIFLAKILKSNYCDGQTVLPSKGQKISYAKKYKILGQILIMWVKLHPLPITIF